MRGNNVYNQMVKEFDHNEFVTVNFLVDLTRKIAAKYNYLLLDSEVISWVLTGEQPPVLNKVRRLRKQERIRRNALIYDILNYVDDALVKTCVTESIKESIKFQNLVYIYTGVNEKPRQARIRILTRMIWYSLHKYE